MLSETVVSVLSIYRLPVLSIETSNYEFRNAGSFSSQPPVYRKFPIIRLAVLDARCCILQDHPLARFTRMARIIRHARAFHNMSNHTKPLHKGLTSRRRSLQATTG
jgi:hypothetical protein